MILFDLLADVHADSEAVTFLLTSNNYSQVADEALEHSCAIRIDVRSYHNSNASPESPAVSLYFDKPF